MAKQLTIPVDQIIQSKHQLREVNKESGQFLELVASIKQMGLINPISVRVQRNEETGEDQYILVDGLHRYSAVCAAGIKEIAAHVLEIGELDAMFAQIVANAQRVETKLYSYSRQLARAIAIDPNLTASRIAEQISKPESYVRKLLGLDTLAPEVGKLLDNNTLGLLEASAIAKLPVEDQFEWASKAAESESQSQFVVDVNAHIKRAKQALATGKRVEDVPFEPTPRMRKLTEVRTVIESEDNSALVKIAEGAKTAAEAVRQTLLWVISLDPETVDAATKAHEAAMSEKKAKSSADKAEAKRKLLEKRKAAVAQMEKELEGLGVNTDGSVEESKTEG